MRDEEHEFQGVLLWQICAVSYDTQTEVSEAGWVHESAVKGKLVLQISGVISAFNSVTGGALGERRL